jgi:hypothetical protein
MVKALSVVSGVVDDFYDVGVIKKPGEKLLADLDLLFSLAFADGQVVN